MPLEVSKLNTSKMLKLSYLVYCQLNSIGSLH